VFGIPGDGRYRLQPMHVRDHAGLLVQTGMESTDQIVDSAGPDIFTFEELVHLLRGAMGLHTLVVRMPPAIAMLGASLAGRLTGDLMLTRDELDDLMHDILISHEPPRGRTRLTDWLRTNAETVGRVYASEVARHYRRPGYATKEAA
jgi:NADH dehydrogenase